MLLTGLIFVSSSLKHYHDLGSETSSVWYFWAHFSDVILQETSGGVMKSQLFSQAKKKYSVSSQDQTQSIELKIPPIFVLILYFCKALHMHRLQMSHIFYYCEKV